MKPGGGHGLRPCRQGYSMSDPKKQNSSNLKMALTLGSIALVFFLSVFVKRAWLG